MTEAQIRNIMKQEIASASAASRYQLSPTTNHSHNGTDSQTVSWLDLDNQQFPVASTIPGTSAATPANYGPFYIATFQCSVQAMYQSHTANGAAGTLFVEILKPGQASGSGVALHGFDMTTGANGVSSSKLRRGGTAARLNIGDRLSLFLSLPMGTPTSVGLTQVTASVLLQID